MTVFNGTAKRDVLNGKSGADILRGKNGNDYLNGKGGNDLLEGGNGNDKLDGSTGHDTLRGGNDIDALFGGTGNDLLFGDNGNDYLWDLSGANKLSGGAGNDRLVAVRTAVSMDGGSGNDTLVVETSTKVSSAENLKVSGGTGSDTLHLIADKATVVSPPGLFDERYTYDALAVVNLGSAGSGAFGVGNPYDKSEYNFMVNSGTFSGIENFSVGSDTVLWYDGRGAAAGTGHVTVKGGAQDDIFQGGRANETFVPGDGFDRFDFSHGADLGSPDFRPQGTDKIVGFDPAEDIVMFRWGEGNNQEGEVSIVEKAGHTILTSHIDDTVFHVLDVDAVGIQIWYDFVPA